MTKYSMDDSAMIGSNDDERISPEATSLMTPANLFVISTINNIRVTPNQVVKISLNMY